MKAYIMFDLTLLAVMLSLVFLAGCAAQPSMTERRASWANDCRAEGFRSEPALMLCMQERQKAFAMYSNATGVQRMMMGDVR